MKFISYYNRKIYSLIRTLRYYKGWSPMMIFADTPGGMGWGVLPHRNQNGKTKGTMINSLPMIRFSHKKTGAGASLLG